MEGSRDPRHKWSKESLRCRGYRGSSSDVSESGRRVVEEIRGSVEGKWKGRLKLSREETGESGGFSGGCLGALRPDT